MMGERKGVMVRKVGRSVEIIDIFTPPVSDFMWSSHQQEGTTPLHEACCHGSMDCIQVLLKHKACANIWDVVRHVCVHVYLAIIPICRFVCVCVWGGGGVHRRASYGINGNAISGLILCKSVTDCNVVCH